MQNPLADIATDQARVLRVREAQNLPVEELIVDDVMMVGPDEWLAANVLMINGRPLGSRL